MRSQLLALTILALTSVVANAVPVTLNGVGFNVTYDSDALGLFGTPLLLDGDTLVFSPTQFSADSNSASWDLTNSTILLTLEADPGYNLGSATLTEQGDYILLGNNAKVLVGGQTRAVDFRTPLVDSPAAITGAGLGDLTQHDVVTANWDATSTQSFALGATQVRFTIQNLLAANAGDASDLAFIEKKFVALNVSDFVVSSVPEPSTYAMLLAGLGILGFVALRKAR